MIDLWGFLRKAISPGPTLTPTSDPAVSVYEPGAYGSIYDEGVTDISQVSPHGSGISVVERIGQGIKDFNKGFIPLSNMGGGQSAPPPAPSSSKVPEQRGIRPPMLRFSKPSGEGDMTVLAPAATPGLYSGFNYAVPTPFSPFRMGSPFLDQQASQLLARIVGVSRG